MQIRQYRERLRTYWEYLRTSLWFVPALMLPVAVILSLLALKMDKSLSDSPLARLPGLVYVNDPDAARGVLSTLLSSMITMASLVFSITMVVLTLAASQFGPRLIRSFMASPQTQVVLGAFVMTIVYCLLVLWGTEWRSSSGPFPYPSVSGAIGLALASVTLLILYLHALARSIMSETVIERVGRELDQALQTLPQLRAEPMENPDAAVPEDFETSATFFGPNRVGYVQAIEFDELVAVARAADVLVGLYFRAGDFVIEDGRGIGVYPAERYSEQLAEKTTACLMIGAHRTPVQDPDFSIRHLVEIAVRALSPGVNDPYTALSAINRLSGSLAHLLNRALPPGVFRDHEGAVRVICPRPSYASLIGAALAQIRQNGADKPVIVIHLLDAIARLAPHAPLPEQRAALREQLEIIVDTAGQRIRDPSDLADIGRSAEDARKALASLRPSLPPRMRAGSK